MKDEIPKFWKNSMTATGEEVRTRWETRGVNTDVHEFWFEGPGEQTMGSMRFSCGEWSLENIYQQYGELPMCMKCHDAMERRRKSDLQKAIDYLSARRLGCQAEIRSLQGIIKICEMEEAEYKQVMEKEKIPAVKEEEEQKDDTGSNNTL